MAIYKMSFDYPRLVAGTVLAMSLVGVVYALLLQGLRPLEAMMPAEVRGSFV